MRHRNKVKKLGRTASHRKALLKNLASNLIEHKQIRTTQVKAKALQQHIEKLITTSKTDSVHARRMVFKHLQNRTLVKVLFDEIAPTFSDRKGGYTRVVKLGRRQGDGAEMAMIQLVGFEALIVDDGPGKKKAKPAKKAAAAPKAKKKEETPAEEAPAAAETEEAADAEAPAVSAPGEEAPAEDAPAEEKEPAKPKKKAPAKKAPAKKAAAKDTAEKKKAAPKKEKEDTGEAKEPDDSKDKKDD